MLHSLTILFKSEGHVCPVFFFLMNQLIQLFILDALLCICKPCHACYY